MISMHDYKWVKAHRMYRVNPSVNSGFSLIMSAHKGSEFRTTIPHQCELSMQLGTGEDVHGNSVFCSPKTTHSK
jgi:hypothetical protein